MRKIILILLCMMTSPAHAADPKNNDMWFELTAKFRAKAEKQATDNSWYAKKCDKKKHFCFRSMEMVNDEGYLVSVVELLDENQTSVHDRMICTMLNKERTFRKCRNFDSGIEVLDKYINGKWVLANPPV